MNYKKNNIRKIKIQRQIKSSFFSYKYNLNLDLVYFLQFRIQTMLFNRSFILN